MVENLFADSVTYDYENFNKESLNLLKNNNIAIQESGQLTLKIKDDNKLIDALNSFGNEANYDGYIE